MKIKSFFTPIKRNAGTAVTPTPDTPVELKTNKSRVNVENIFPESEDKSVLPLKGMGFSGTQKEELILMQTPQEQKSEPEIQSLEIIMK